MARSHPPSLLRRTGRILARTGKAFFADNVSRLGAALAFYITVAVAPLIVLTLAVAGMIFQDESARDTVLGEMNRLMGANAAAVVTSVEPPTQSRNGVLATTLGIVTLLFGALGVFVHLQDALNAIWRAAPRTDKGLWPIVRRRLFSLATVLMTGFLLLVSLVLSAMLSWFGAQWVGRLPAPPWVLQTVNLSLAFVITTVLFALIFKLLPDAKMKWRHVWLGAAVTSLLFSVGKWGLGIYLARGTVTSAYGAASSAIALLIWCYYAAQIVFLGAEFTRITSRSDGGRDFSRLDEPAEQKRN
jgi:membrane protein